MINIIPITETNMDVDLNKLNLDFLINSPQIHNNLKKKSSSK